jgi:hypothetical protein
VSLPYILPVSLHAELIYEVVVQYVPNYFHLTITPFLLFTQKNQKKQTHSKPAFGAPTMFHRNSLDYDKSRSELGITLSYTKSINGLLSELGSLNHK